MGRSNQQPQSSPSRACRSPGGRRRRSGAILVASACGLLLAGVAGASWYFAGRLAEVRPVVEGYPLRVVAIHPDRGEVILSRGPDVVEPGSFRLAWRDGHATTGPVLAQTKATVTRTLASVSGRLRVGERVGIQSNPFTGDPRSALGLTYADVTVPTGLGAMPAWYLAGRRRTWVLLIHGLDGSRADTLPVMPALSALGFPMLAVTLRNDRGAPASPDGRSHLGDTEWHDLAAAIRYARAQGADGVILYGMSLGAGMAVVASERSAYRDAVRGLVLDSPLLDWRATLEESARRHGVPTLLTGATTAMLALRLGVHLDRYDWRRLAIVLATRALVVQGDHDTVVPPTVTDAFAHARPDLITYLRVVGADHVSAVDTDPAGYLAALRRFLGLVA